MTRTSSILLFLSCASLLTLGSAAVVASTAPGDRVVPTFYDRSSGRKIPSEWVRLRANGRALPVRGGLDPRELEAPDAAWLVSVPSPDGIEEVGIALEQARTDEDGVYVVPRAPRIRIGATLGQPGPPVSGARVEVAFVQEDALLEVLRSALNGSGVDPRKEPRRFFDALLTGYLSQVVRPVSGETPGMSPTRRDALLGWQVAVESADEPGSYLLYPDRVGTFVYRIVGPDGGFAWDLGSVRPGEDFARTEHLDRHR